VKVLSRLAFAAIAVLLATSAWSQTTADIAVSAAVNEACRITATPVAFGTYDPVGTHAAAGTDLDATGTVVVRCTKNAAGVSIELGDGLHFSGGRRMANAGVSEFLNYQLFKPSGTAPSDPCAYTAPWRTAALTADLQPTATWGAAVQHSFNVCGRVARGQDAAADSFSDTIQATVNF
jgi:spore coat protein U-like protein